MREIEFFVKYKLKKNYFKVLIVKIDFAIEKFFFKLRIKFNLYKF